MQRRPVLAFIFCFDIAVYLFRLLARKALTDTHASQASMSGVLFQMGNMLALYAVVSTFNWRLKRTGAQVSLADPSAELPCPRALRGTMVHAAFLHRAWTDRLACNVVVSASSTLKVLNGPVRACVGSASTLR